MTAAPGITVRRIEDPRPGMRVAAKGGKGGAQAQDKPTIAQNTLRSLATVRILEVLSEGPIFGPAISDHSPFQSVFLDETAVVDSNGTWQFKLSQADFRLGLPEQDPIAGYPITETVNSVGVQLHSGIPIVRACTTPPLHAVRYILRIPALYGQTDKGDVTQASVSYTFDIQVNGGAWTNVITETISGKTTSPYERAVRVQLPVPNPDTLSIRVTRLDPDPAPEVQNLLFFSAFVEIIDGQLAYDDTAVASMALDAETFPQIPQRAYLLDGLLVDIPSNYDPRARTYSPTDWDGTFKQGWTSNPAWVLYAILTNERWGLGRFLDAGMVDKWSFYEAALNNDALVPDGKGGTEPRWTCNCVINTRQDAYTVLNSIASCMVGLLYWSNGTVFLVQDRLVTSSGRLFGPADVENGLFDYQGTDYRSRWTAAAVTWIDPDDFYKQAVELVQDQALVARQGYRETQVNAFACTSRGQAIRFGRWLIYTSQFEIEVVTFRVGLENADLRPGDLVSISDPSRAGARLAGRVLADDGLDTVTLDSMGITHPTGWTLYVTVGTATEGQRPSILVLPVVALLPNNQVQVTGKTQPIPAGSMWLASNAQVQPTHWRVAAVADRGKGLYEILATEYHEEKPSYVDLGVLIPPPSFSLVPTGPLVPPSDVHHQEYIYLDGSGVPQFGVVITWQASTDPRITRYQLELSGPAGDYRRFNHVVGIGWDVPAMRQGTWIATLVGFDNLGRRTIPVAYTFTPTGLTARPLPPKALYLTPQGATTTLVWVPSGEIDVVSYWVKWSPRVDGTANWVRATTTIAQVNRSTTQVTTPSRSGTYMVKTIDGLGQESEAWAEAILLAQITNGDGRLPLDEQPDWTGDLGAHWEIHDPELRLAAPTEPEAIPPGVFPGDRAVSLNQTPTRLDVYGFANTFDASVLSAINMSAVIEGYGTLGDGTMSSWKPLASAKPLAVDGSNHWDAHIEVRASQDGATFGEWSPLNSAQITGTKFEWRVVGTIYDLATTLRLSRAEVRLEVPVRTVTGDDAPLDGTGHLTVTYAVPFLAKPSVTLTARESLAPGGNIVLTDSTVDHFTVEHRDATGAPFAGGAIDYLVQGYGGHA